MTDEFDLMQCDGGCGGPVSGEEFDSETARIIAKHPCFSLEASRLFGRIHLAVAPECNVQCNFCLREFDCVNESRPGVASRVLTPAEALDRVERVMATFEHIRTVGIAGPGEPLYNEETFETFRLVRDKFPDLHLCISSNGLLLPEKVDILHDLRVETITVTMNAVDPEIGKQIYSWVYYEGNYYRDVQGAELVLSKQLEGIKLAVEKGMLVKVNTVMIPTVNDHHLTEIAKKARELGAFMQNIMPLIPQYKFAHLNLPTAGERKAAQDTCNQFIRQMRHCRQCRADAIGLLGKDLSQEMFEPKKLEEAEVGTGFEVAVTTSTKDGWVDLHFGSAPRFLVYEVGGDSFRLLEARDAKLTNGKTDLSQAADLLSDCHYVITRKAGPRAVEKLQKAGIEMIEDYNPIDTAIRNLVQRIKNGANN
jgi:nitrogen fixation protein NifB